MQSLKFIISYLTNRHQRIKINNSYSLWKLTKYGVPQGSILSLALFNIFLHDSFFTIDNVDLANYADGNTPNTQEKLPNKILEKLICASRNIYSNGSLITQ